MQMARARACPHRARAHTLACSRARGTRRGDARARADSAQSGVVRASGPARACGRAAIWRATRAARSKRRARSGVGGSARNCACVCWRARSSGAPGAPGARARGLAIPLFVKIRLVCEADSGRRIAVIGVLGSDRCRFAASLQCGAVCLESLVLVTGLCGPRASGEVGVERDKHALLVRGVAGDSAQSCRSLTSFGRNDGRPCVLRWAERVVSCGSVAIREVVRTAAMASWCGRGRHVGGCDYHSNSGGSKRSASGGAVGGACVGRARRHASAGGSVGAACRRRRPPHVGRPSAATGRSPTARGAGEGAALAARASTLAASSLVVVKVPPLRPASTMRP